MTDASVIVQHGVGVTTLHACSRCGQHFWFASRKPEPSWTCRYCAEEVPASAYSEDTPDAAPLNLCPHCIGGVAGGDVCERCWGSGKGE